MSNLRLKEREAADPKQRQFIFVAEGSDPAERATQWRPAVTTVVLDSLWRFAFERHQVYLRRLRGVGPPWTSNRILQGFRFTNAFRAADRTSQYLIRSVIYEGDWNPEDTFFRIMLFKFFNRSETWVTLNDRLGPLTWKEYRFDRYDKVLSEEQGNGRPLYSSAYIIPSPQIVPTRRKYTNHLRLLEAMMADRLPRSLARARNLEQVFGQLRAYPGIGDFLAYQYAIDLNYSELIDFSEMEFVVPGPGARDGLRKAFPHHGGLSEVELIELLTSRQEEELARLNLPRVTLWGRPLQLIDCQNLLCEVDKYARLAHPTIQARSRRTRMKRKFKPGDRLGVPWFPPKWGVNRQVEVWGKANAGL